MYGLAAICHEVRKDGYIGSCWPSHRRAFTLLTRGRKKTRRHGDAEREKSEDLETGAIEPQIQ